MVFHSPSPPKLEIPPPPPEPPEIEPEEIEKKRKRLRKGRTTVVSLRINPGLSTLDGNQTGLRIP